MSRQTWVFAICFALVLLSGCGTTSSVKFAMVPPDVASFKLQDDRPADQRASHVDPNNLGEMIYFADDNLDPTPPDLLRTWLHEHIGPQLVGKQISLEEFVVNVYQPQVDVDMDRLSNSAASVPGGAAVAPLAYWVIYGIEKSKSEKNVGVRMVGKVEDKEFSSFVLERFRGRITEEDIQKTIVKALDKIVIEIQRVMSDQ